MSRKKYGKLKHNRNKRRHILIKGKELGTFFTEFRPELQKLSNHEKMMVLDLFIWLYIFSNLLIDWLKINGGPQYTTPTARKPPTDWPQDKLQPAHPEEPEPADVMR